MSVLIRMTKENDSPGSQQPPPMIGVGPWKLINFPPLIHPHHAPLLMAKASTNRINPFKFGKILNLEFVRHGRAQRLGLLKWWVNTFPRKRQVDSELTRVFPSRILKYPFDPCSCLLYKVDQMVLFLYLFVVERRIEPVQS